jgi:hypothetical protein
LGAWRRISSSTSAMAFTATEFLFVFLTRPISRVKPWPLRVGSFRSATKTEGVDSDDGRSTFQGVQLAA